MRASAKKTSAQGRRALPDCQKIWTERQIFCGARSIARRGGAALATTFGGSTTGLGASPRLFPSRSHPAATRRHPSARRRRVKSTAECLRRPATRLGGLPKGFGRGQRASTKRQSVEAPGECLRHDAETSREAPKLLGMTPKGLGRRRRVSGGAETCRRGAEALRDRRCRPLRASGTAGDPLTVFVERSASRRSGGNPVDAVAPRKRRGCLPAPQGSEQGPGSRQVQDSAQRPDSQG